jgi:pimeloyl-ACP methyl ester carboxylesterase
MITPLRLLAKGSFLLCVLVLLLMGFLLAWFASWRADRIALLNSSSDLGKTNRGVVEFLSRGEGGAVLVFHGAPGGYDQAILLGSSFAEGDFQIIAPSRPGYLRTPLTTGSTPEEQADAMAGLLDTLGISRVAVLASSCGAPAGIQFVIRHPQKVWALVLVSALLSKADPLAQPQASELARFTRDRFGADFAAWLLFEATGKDPGHMLSLIVDAENNGTSLQRESLVGYVLNDPDQLDWIRSLIGTFVPLTAREAGIRNDFVQIRAMHDLPFERISLPTLLVHGTADKCVPFGEAEATARKIPGAILLPVQGAGHLVGIGPWAAGVQSKIAEFFRQHSGGQSLK